MRRRQFITLVGTAAALPAVARAQQSKMPVIGFLSGLSLADSTPHLARFSSALGEAGWTEGRNIVIEYRFADGQYGRLPELAAGLVRRQVDLIVAQTPPAAVAAKTSTSTIPIVFAVGVDPVAAGLVASFNQPGGNATGIALYPGPIAQKRPEIVRDIAPKAAEVALLLNPTPEGAREVRDVEAAAEANKLKLRVLNAATASEIGAAFDALERRRPDALLIGADPFYVIRRQDIVGRVARGRFPAIYPAREFVDDGGLISYGINLVAAYGVVGTYAGRILRGAKPAELPVTQPTTLELVINLKTARAQAIDIPPTLQARADEVIE